MNTVILICPQCKKEFSCSYKNRNRRKYCSLSCSSSARSPRVIIQCAKCGKERSVIQSKMNAKSGIYFCSRHCKNAAQAIDAGILQHKNYKNGVNRYRLRAFNKYGKLCYVCGYDIEQVLQVHHIDSNRSNNKLNNLVVLCPTHHKECDLKLRIIER